MGLRAGTRQVTEPVISAQGGKAQSLVLPVRHTGWKWVLWKPI